MGESINKYRNNARPTRRAYIQPDTKVKVKNVNTAKVDAYNKRQEAKRDIYGGKDAKLVENLKATERAWGLEDSPIEKAKTYNEGGTLQFVNDRGTPHSVSVPMWARTNNTVTHIHPSTKRKYGVDDIAARIGTPLSPTDVKNAIIAGQRETRAVAPGYTFSMRPKDGNNWNVSSRQWTTAYNKAMYEAENRFGRVLYRAMGTPHYMTALSRFNVVTQDYALRTAAKRLGLTYTRAKR